MLRGAEVKGGGIKLTEGGCSSPQPNGRAQEALGPAPVNYVPLATRRMLDARAPPSSASDGSCSPLLHGMESGGRGGSLVTFTAGVPR
jgi:hypothetical protein